MRDVCPDDIVLLCINLKDQNRDEDRLTLLVLRADAVCLLRQTDSEVRCSRDCSQTRFRTAFGQHVRPDQTHPYPVAGRRFDAAAFDRLFNGVVSKAFGKGLYVAQGGQAQKDAINVRLDDSLPSEGYTLLITPDSIDIAGGSPAGVFYAFQSLRQLLPAAALAGERARVIELPAVEIRDEPHFAYRGAMLDACRHFFKPDEVKEYLDLLALHKINRFHWHLTDDQGWRIEIKNIPN